MVIELIDTQRPFIISPALKEVITGVKKVEQTEAPPGWTLDTEIISDPRVLPIIAAGYLPLVTTTDAGCENSRVARMYVREFNRRLPQRDLTPEEMEAEDLAYVEEVLDKTTFPEFSKWDFDITKAREELKSDRENERKNQRHLAEIVSVHKAIFFWKEGSLLDGNELLRALPEPANSPKTQGYDNQQSVNKSKTFLSFQQLLTEKSKRNGNAKLTKSEHTTLPDLFVVPGFHLGRDYNEISDDPYRIESGGWVNDWKDEVASATADFHGYAGSSDQIKPSIFANRNLVNHLRVLLVDYQLNHMAQNYLALVRKMKAEGLFPKGWELAYRYAEWQKNRKMQNSEVPTSEIFPF